MYRIVAEKAFVRAGIAVVAAVAMLGAVIAIHTALVYFEIRILQWAGLL